jgi:hypothetical protein
MIKKNSNTKKMRSGENKLPEEGRTLVEKQ